MHLCLKERQSKHACLCSSPSPNTSLARFGGPRMGGTAAWRSGSGPQPTGCLFYTLIAIMRSPRLRLPVQPGRTLRAYLRRSWSWKGYKTPPPGAGEDCGSLFITDSFASPLENISSGLHFIPLKANKSVLTYQFVPLTWFVRRNFADKCTCYVRGTKY